MSMDMMHSLLKRQLKRHQLDPASVPPQWQAFIDDVDSAYEEFDADRRMVERSLELSSQELVDANSQMRAVFQAIPDLVLRLDRQGTILDIKAGATGDLVLEREECIGLPLQETPLKDAAQLFLSAVRSVIADNAPITFEYSAWPQGRETHFEARLVPLQGQQQAVVIIRDITRRKHADRRVREDLSTLHRAAQAAQVITQHQVLESMLQEVADQARAVVRAHQCFVRMLGVGHRPRMVQGVSLSDRYSRWHARQSPPHASAAADALLVRAGLPLRLARSELPAHPLAGNWAQHEPGRPPLRGWLVTALKNRQGETVGLLELSDKYHDGEFSQQDQYVVEALTHIASTAIENIGLVEEVRQFNAELELRVQERTEALARQEALFQAAADQAPQVMWIADTDGKVTYLNRSWYALVGGAPPQWHGDQWTEVVLAEDVAEMREKWASVSQRRGVFAGSRRVRAADGSLHILSYRVSAVLDARGEVTCWIGMDADVTENKAIEEALRLSNRELEAFSYSVSHDLRAPLSAIDGFSQLLAEQLDPQAPPRIHHYMARIRHGVTHMGQLIESLLALAQISRKTLLPVPVDLSSIAASVLADLQARDPQRQVSVTIERDLLVKCDAGLLAIAMENLLGNAWKFTSHKDGARISVGRKPKASDGETVFFVADNGAGFDMDYASKLFGTFQRLHSAAEFPGTGVGLATVKRVIARHGGQVWGESQPGQGATFFFTLPDNQLANPGSNHPFRGKKDSRFGPL